MALWRPESGFKSLWVSQGDEMKFTTLEDFKGHMKLSRAEKDHRLRTLGAAKFAGEIDKVMIEYLDNINNLPSFCTTQSCWGHQGDNEKKAHIDIRTSFSFEKLYEAVCGWMGDYGVELQVYGEEMGMPRFCFWLRHHDWHKAMDALCVILRKLQKQG